MNADIYLTNISDKKMAIGMISIAPGETKKILKKIFDRKASYVTRMIKEHKLAFYAPNAEVKANKKASAPSKDKSQKEDDSNANNQNVTQKKNRPAGNNANAKEANKADASNNIEKPKDKTAEKPKDPKKATAAKQGQGKK